MTTETVLIEGMTCGHCVQAVTSEITSLRGVRDVSIELVSGGVSRATIVTDDPIATTAVAAAITEAGYRMVAPAN